MQFAPRHYRPARNEAAAVFAHVLFISFSTLSTPCDEIIGHNSRRALSRFVLSGQLLSGAS
jgi:hypothetical protein